MNGSQAGPLVSVEVTEPGMRVPGLAISVAVEHRYEHDHAVEADYDKVVGRGRDVSLLGRYSEQRGTVGHGRGDDFLYFIGCFWKNSHIRSLAEMSLVDFPMNGTGGTCPGHVWPPPSTVTRTTSDPSLPPP